MGEYADGESLWIKSRTVGRRSTPPPADDLKSAVLQRRDDAIRFCSAWPDYRNELHPGAVARGNKKVEARHRTGVEPSRYGTGAHAAFKFGSHEKSPLNCGAVCCCFVVGSYLMIRPADE